MKANGPTKLAVRVHKSDRHYIGSDQMQASPSTSEGANFIGLTQEQIDRAFFVNQEACPSDAPFYYFYNKR